ncbi:hypothetical protein CVU37_04280 [candidate division BRC1 bacterium HGW-BRC1-1]|nr:MAG: hypothetical protein CVU37_04280 [candidate division BRC1 bacterium HGW-BRC1-1]
MKMELTTSRKNFVSAMKMLRSLGRPRKGAEAVISFLDGCVNIRLDSGVTGCPAEGEWVGEVRVPASFIISLISVPPTGDPVVIRNADGRLCVGGSSIDCTWQSPPGAAVWLPANASLGEILSLQNKYSEDDISRAGLDAVVESATEEAEKKILIASDALEELGVEPYDVREMVEAIIKERFAD